MKRVAQLRIIIHFVLVLGLAAAVIAMPHAIPDALAQGDGEQPITFGENKPGAVPAGGFGVYFFEGQAGDVAEVTVLGFGFGPVVEIMDANRTTVLARESNDTGAESVTLSYAVTTPGRHYILVSGLNGASGNFAISLNKGTRVLPPGTPLAVGQTLQGTVQSADQPAVYDFATSPDSTVNLSVRSLTGGYIPVVTITTGDGTPLFSLSNPRLLGMSFTFAPGGESLKAVIDQGTFTGPATVELVLSGGGAAPTGTGPQATQEPSDGGASSEPGIGLASAPASGCYVTVTQRTNVRSGGSTNHPVVGVLGAGEYLVVTGFSAENDGWYRTSIPTGGEGWIASFVSTTGGSCDNLPPATFEPAPSGGDSGSQPTATTDPNASPTPTYTPTATLEPGVTPTATYTPTATTEAAPTAPPHGDYADFEVNIKGDTATIMGQISFPNGNTTDRIFYRAIGFDSVTTSGNIRATMTCSGSGVENVRVNYANVGSVGTQGCNTSNVRLHTTDSDQGFIRIDLVAGDNALVNWTLVLTAE